MALKARQYASISSRRAARPPTFLTALSPVPIPKMARPFESSCNAANPLAATDGWRVMGLLTVVHNLTLLVRIAIAVSATNGSGSRFWVSPYPARSYPQASVTSIHSRYSCMLRHIAAIPSRVVMESFWSVSDHRVIDRVDGGAAVDRSRSVTWLERDRASHFAGLEHLEAAGRQQCRELGRRGQHIGVFGPAVTVLD